MSRRKTVFDDVMEMPWPVGVIAAGISFLVFQVFLSKSPEGQLASVTNSAVSMIGWFLTGMFLLAAFFSFLRQVIQGKRFKATRSMAEVRALTWRQFESFIGAYFRRQGYLVIETAEGPDNGVDLVLRKEGEKAYVQCKQWKTNQVPVEKIRELLGSMAAGGAQAGIFVTSGTYTPPARELARQSGIRLIDGAELARLLNFSGTGIGPGATALSPGASQSCPECGAPMKRRIAKRGQHRGRPFYGCSQYPGCKGIRNI